MRRIGAAVVLTVLVAACSTGGSGGQTAGPGPTSAGQATSPGQATTTGGGGSGILDAVKAAAAHACDVLPTDLVATIVPSPPAPQEELFPARCSVFGDQVAIAFSLDQFSALGETPQGPQDISGFANRAYLEKLSPGNFTLWVAITPDAGVLFAEVNNQDGKDHTDEVVNLAKAILAKLGG
jgi:hypothetical protein